MEHLPKRYGVILYDGFQLLDVCGPVDVINVLSSYVEGISLALIAETKSPLSTLPRRWPNNMDMPPFTTAQTMKPTHDFATAPDLDVLLIPGGMGCFDPDAAGQPNAAIMDPIIQFVRERYPALKYLLTVCTGSGIVAMSGLLDGKRATTYKGAWKVIPAWRPEVMWVPKARWVVDGNIWTSSGVSSGIDLLFGFVKQVYGAEIAKDVAVWMEYNRHEDPDADPFGIEGVV